MEFRVLGPVGMQADGQEVRCTGRPLQLLALLLVERGTAVGHDVAVEALWPDQLPAHPANSLQVAAHRLRRIAGEERILWDGGYRLALAPGDGVDADRFADLHAAAQAALERGDAAAARRASGDALELWHGHAYDDVRFESFAVAAAERLEEERLACLEIRLEADLALGRHSDVVGELRALTVRHPLRERLRGQLMLALYRGGRQSDALEEYRAFRRELKDRLGLEPSAALRATERAILRHEAGVPTAPAARREVVCVAGELGAAHDGRPLDPEILEQVVAGCHAAVDAVVRRHGGPFVDLRGTELALVFGSKTAHEDDAARAARTASVLQRRLAELAAELGRDDGILLTARLAIAAGPALVGTGALPLGEVIDRARRLARAAPPGTVATDERTRALLAARAPASDVPLVGRAAELARIEAECAATARDGTARLLAVLGEPGIGKSRLAREAAGRLSASATVLAGRCPPYGASTAVWPLREMVTRLAGGAPVSALTTAAGDGEALASAVARALGLEIGTQGEVSAATFARFFAVAAGGAPVVLLFEDLHWADASLLDLIDELAVQPAPLLLLCLARPELADARPAWTAGAVRLGALDALESAELLARRQLPAGQRDAIAARARGNPLFLEQLAAHVADRGAGLPPSLEPLLAARLDLLDPDERKLLEAGAVEGERFHLGGVLAQVPRTTGAAAGQSFDRLVERELLWPATADVAGERAWRFRHALVREAAYALVARRRRVAGHRLLAAWLEGADPPVPEADARIGRHLELAYGLAAGLEPAAVRDALALQATARLAAAAETAHRRGDLRDEIRFLDRAVGLAGSHPATRADLLPPLAAALFEAGTLARAGDVAAEALALGERLGLERVRRRAAVELQRLRIFTRPETVEPRAALEDCRTAADALAALDDDLGLARACFVMSELTWLQGRVHESQRLAERMVRHAHRARSGFEVDTGVSSHAWALVVGERPASAAIAECDRLERTVAGPFAALTVRSFRDVLRAMAGDVEPARAEMAVVRAGLRDLGLRQASVWVGMFAAYVDGFAGDHAAAGRALDEAEAVATEIGDRWFLSTIRVDRAHVVLAGGDVTAAAGAVAAIEEIAAPHDAEWRLKRHAARGKLAALEGDPARAGAELRAAAAIADTGEMLTFRADVHRDLALVTAPGGAEHRAALATARTLYARKEHVTGLRALRERFGAEEPRR